jgi:hypothetical protein
VRRGWICDSYSLQDASEFAIRLVSWSYKILAPSWLTEPSWLDRAMVRLGYKGEEGEDTARSLKDKIKSGEHRRGAHGRVGVLSCVSFPWLTTR